MNGILYSLASSRSFPLAETAISLRFLFKDKLNESITSSVFPE